MPAASSAEPAAPGPPAGVGPAGPRRFVMVALGYIPFLHVAAVVAAFSWPFLGSAPRWSWWLASALLFLLPPLTVRLVLAVAPLPRGRIELDSPAFLRWWFAAQWQVVFNRLRFLEELLRLVPGLYSAWLRLWGARIGRFVYWSAGCRILDRSLVTVGDRVLVGLEVLFSPHLMARGHEGRTRLLLGRIEVGAGAILGGYTLLAPGAAVAAGEMTRVREEVPPFTRFEDGGLVRAVTAENMEAAA